MESDEYFLTTLIWSILCITWFMVTALIVLQTAVDRAAAQLEVGKILERLRELEDFARRFVEDIRPDYWRRDRR